jgi:hypothetical protein
MTCTCRLCGAIIQTPTILGGGGIVPPLDAPNREAFDYQATVQALAQHIGRDHAAYVHTLAGTAQTYHYHLIAKLVDSTDPAFLAQREEARALCYWTLAGKFGIEDKPTPGRIIEA